MGYRWKQAALINRLVKRLRLETFGTLDDLILDDRIVPVLPILRDGLSEWKRLYAASATDPVSLFLPDTRCFIHYILAWADGTGTLTDTYVYKEGVYFFLRKTLAAPTELLWQPTMDFWLEPSTLVGAHGTPGTGNLYIEVVYATAE